MLENNSYIWGEIGRSHDRLTRGSTNSFSTLLFGTKLINGTMKEVWKDIPNYEGFYQISNFGKVRSLARIVKCKGGKVKKNNGRILKYYTTGYPSVRLCKEGIANDFYIHRLMAIAFIPNPKNNPCINHKNGVKEDNTLSNLEWCTPKENMIHASSTGLITRIYGKYHHLSKPVIQYDLDDNYVNEYAGGRDAARQTGINRGNISAACAGIVWQAGGYKWKLK